MLLVAFVDDGACCLEALPDGFALVFCHGAYLLVLGVECLQLLECRDDVFLGLVGKSLSLLAEPLFGLQVLPEVILARLDVEFEQVVELLDVVLVGLPYLCGSFGGNGLYLFPCSLQLFELVEVLVSLFGRCCELLDTLNDSELPFEVFCLLTLHLLSYLCPSLPDALHGSLEVLLCGVDFGSPVLGCSSCLNECVACSHLCCAV